MRFPSTQTMTMAVTSRTPTWRPSVPTAFVARALHKDRGGVYPWHPDPARKPPKYSLRSIERTRVEMRKTQALLDPAPRDLARETVQLPHCTAERLRVPESVDGRVILYFHGGGFLRGSTDTHIGAIARFMRASRCEAFSVDYRRAPEAQFPAWLDDAVDAYRHLLETDGVDPARIAFGGDSAGGSIVAALLQQLTPLGLPMPAAAFVISPWVDFTCSGPSHTDNVDTEVMFGPGVIPHCAAWLAEQAGLPADDPLLSPAFGDYSAPGLPPLRIDASELEAMRSDGELLAEAYRRHGAVAHVHLCPGVPHAWTAIGMLRAARRTAVEIGTFVDGHLEG